MRQIYFQVLHETNSIRIDNISQLFSRITLYVALKIGDRCEVCIVYVSGRF